MTTRDNDLKRIKEIQKGSPRTWKEAIAQQMEIDEILLRAIDWAFRKDKKQSSVVANSSPE